MQASNEWAYLERCAEGRAVEAESTRADGSRSTCHSQATHTHTRTHMRIG